MTGGPRADSGAFDLGLIASCFSAASSDRETCRGSRAVRRLGPAPASKHQEPAAIFLPTHPITSFAGSPLECATFGRIADHPWTGFPGATGEGRASTRAGQPQMQRPTPHAHESRPQPLGDSARRSLDANGLWLLRPLIHASKACQSFSETVRGGRTAPEPPGGGVGLHGTVRLSATTALDAASVHCPRSVSRNIALRFGKVVWLVRQQRRSVGAISRRL